MTTLAIGLIAYGLPLAFVIGVLTTDYVWRRAQKERVEDAKARGFTEGLGVGLAWKRLQEQRKRFKNRLELHDGPSKN